MSACTQQNMHGARLFMVGLRLQCGAPWRPRVVVGVPAAVYALALSLLWQVHPLFSRAGYVRLGEVKVREDIVEVIWGNVELKPRGAPSQTPLG